jgi:hypothetical protein
MAVAKAPAPKSSGYGMAGATAAQVASINKQAAANNAVNKQIAYKPTTTTQKAAAQLNSNINYVNNAAKYMPAATPGAQFTGGQNAANANKAKPSALAALPKYPSVSTSYPTNNSTGWQSQGWSQALSGVGNIGAGMGSMGGMSSMLSGLGGMMGGGGLGGGMGGGDPYPPAAPAEEKVPEKEAPQRYWAGGYTEAQQAAMNAGGSPENIARMKAGFDEQNIKSFQGMTSQEEIKKKRVEEAKALAGRSGGQYDSEGNYYSRDILGGIIKDENAKKDKADANRYDVPKGAVPVAATSGDNTPAAAGSGGGGGTGGTGTKPKDDKKPSGKLDNDWLKKLSGLASGWFGGR